jgi:hypothetical protein
MGYQKSFINSTTSMRKKMEEATNRINFDNLKSNLYGCLPCPQCNSIGRYFTLSTHKTHPNHIVCDQCPFKEKYEPEKRSGI